MGIPVIYIHIPEYSALLYLSIFLLWHLLWYIGKDVARRSELRSYTLGYRVVVSPLADVGRWMVGDARFRRLGAVSSKLPTQNCTFALCCSQLNCHPHRPPQKFCKCRTLRSAPRQWAWYRKCLQVQSATRLTRVADTPRPFNWDT